MSYSIQIIDSPKDGINYRITDDTTDSRVATCYLEENAQLVCDALNVFEEFNSKK